MPTPELAEGKDNGEHLYERITGQMRLRDVKEKRSSTPCISATADGLPVFDVTGLGAYICQKANNAGANLHGIFSR